MRLPNYLTVIFYFFLPGDQPGMGLKVNQRIIMLIEFQNCPGLDSSR